MANRKVVSVIDIGYESFEVERKILKEAGYDLKIFSGSRHDLAGKIVFAKDSEGLFIRWTQINEQVLQELPNLKAIVRYGVGYDNINLEDARQFGVKVANVSGYATHSVSDHALMLIFAVLRDLHGSIRQLKNDYTQPGRQDAFELNDKTLGIIGLGRIGSMLSKKSKALFKKVIAYDPHINERRFLEAGAESVELGTLFQQADVISIHCNLSEETHHMIDLAEFHQMVKRPILINTARGGVVNESAMKRALENDMLYGAGIDVFRDEPPLEDMDSVIRHPKVIATGHNAWYSAEAMKNLQFKAVQNMVSMLCDQNCDDLLT